MKLLLIQYCVNAVILNLHVLFLFSVISYTAKTPRCKNLDDYFAALSALASLRCATGIQASAKRISNIDQRILKFERNDEA